jgi:hypothetical protein
MRNQNYYPDGLRLHAFMLLYFSQNRKGNRRCTSQGQSPLAGRIGFASITFNSLTCKFFPRYRSSGETPHPNTQINTRRSAAY